MGWRTVSGIWAPNGHTILRISGTRHQLRVVLGGFSQPRHFITILFIIVCKTMGNGAKKMAPIGRYGTKLASWRIMSKGAYAILGVAGLAAMVVGLVLMGMAAAGERLEPGVYAVPTLSVWGKVIALLSLGALGASFLVWRQVVVRANAILETSPLGASPMGVRRKPVALVDWRLLILVGVVMEILAAVGLWVAHWSHVPVSRLDVVGWLFAAAIVAFIAHLVVIAGRIKF